MTSPHDTLALIALGFAVCGLALGLSALFEIAKRIGPSGAATLSVLFTLLSVAVMAFANWVGR